MSWNDFNSADDQSGFDVIPNGTLVKIRMTIKPGGHDDASQGWTGGWATRSNTTGAVYLNCEFAVLDGKYARRKIWSLIVLCSAKGPDWDSSRILHRGIKLLKFMELRWQISLGNQDFKIKLLHLDFLHTDEVLYQDEIA